MQDSGSTEGKKRGGVLRPKMAAPYLGEAESTFWLKAKNDPDHPKTFKLGPRTTVVYVDDCDRYLAKKRAECNGQEVSA